MKKRRSKHNTGSVNGRAHNVFVQTCSFYDNPLDCILHERNWAVPVIAQDTIAINAMSRLDADDHLWVVEDHKSMVLCGIINQRDLLQIMTPKKNIPFFGFVNEQSFSVDIHEKIERIMDYKVVTCTVNDPIDEIVKRMNHADSTIAAIVDPGTRRITGEIELSQIVYQYYRWISKSSSLNPTRPSGFHEVHPQHKTDRNRPRKV